LCLTSSSRDFEHIKFVRYNNEMTQHCHVGNYWNVNGIFIRMHPHQDYVPRLNDSAGTTAKTETKPEICAADILLFYIKKIYILTKVVYFFKYLLQCKHCYKPFYINNAFPSVSKVVLFHDYSQSKFCMCFLFHPPLKGTSHCSLLYRFYLCAGFPLHWG
jgi:hypothetical protein